MKILISGGGTGGHIYPAIAIANALKAAHPEVEIKFVGAEGRMEMEKVPIAGYPIEGLPIAGFQRKFSWKNFTLPFKIFKSMQKASKIVKRFRPDVVVGVGGYASGPTVRAAQRLKVPTVLQEQNSYAGVTNKILARNADAICVAYDNMERFFPAEKIVITGNPIRKTIHASTIKQDEAVKFFGLDPNKKTILLFGGSLGARTLNEVVKSNTDRLRKREDLQLIWQVGKSNFKSYKDSETTKLGNVFCSDFIYDMDQAYAAADVVICRAGALTISELCAVGKACVLVPSPHVAEDHQTQNARAIVDQHAALMVKDVEAQEKLLDEAFHLVDSDQMRKIFEKEIKKLGRPDAVDKIVKIIVGVIKR